MSMETRSERFRLWRLFGVLAVASLPCLLNSGAVQSAAALHAFAESARPYFVPAHAGLLYLWAPAVAISACIFLLTPGLLLSLALGVSESAGRWMLSGFTLSLVVLSVATGTVQSLMGRPLRGGAFMLLVAACSLAGLAILLLRRPRAWPLGRGRAGVTLAVSVTVAWLLLAALAPKFYWENFNGDGAHAYEAGRLLLYQPVPFWHAAAGEISQFPDLRSFLFTYPTSWFVRLFGEIEASARVPLVLYLAALFGAILALIESGRKDIPGAMERWLIWLALAVYAVVMGFSATYSFYCADLALPATQDTLLMVCYLGFVLEFVEKRTGWIWFYATLTYTSAPNGVLLIGLWLVGAWLFFKPRPWREGGHAAAAVAACVFGSAILPGLLARLQLPVPGHEYGLAALNRYTYLLLSDWKRLAYIVVPCGILPAISLFFWKGHDSLSRALTFVTAAYFIGSYVQAFSSLHQFVPVMLLPIVVFWRHSIAANQRRRSAMLATVAGAGLAALILSFPTNFRPDTSGRRFGATIEDRTDGYNRSEPAAFRRAELLPNIVPYDWHPAVPERMFGGSPLIWSYYAHRASKIRPPVNYVLQRAGEPPPPAMRFIAADQDTAMYVRDEAVWKRHLAVRPLAPVGSPVFRIPHSRVFRRGGVPLDANIIDVKDLLKRCGIDVLAIAERLGVRHVR